MADTQAAVIVAFISAIPLDLAGSSALAAPGLRARCALERTVGCGPLTRTGVEVSACCPSARPSTRPAHRDFREGSTHKLLLVSESAVQDRNTTSKYLHDLATNQ